MNVEDGTEAALFPEKEYTNGIFLEVCRRILIAKLLRQSRHCAPIAMIPAPNLSLKCYSPPPPPVGQSVIFYPKYCVPETA